MVETLGGCCCENEYELSYTDIGDVDPACVPTADIVCCSTDCPGTAGGARCFELVVAGVTNGVCTHCNGYDGTFILEITSGPFASSCIWTAVITNACNSPTLTAYGMRRDTLDSSFMSITLSAFSAEGPVLGVQVRYRIPFADFDCNGPNTFTLTSQSTGCSWPATITIEPIAC